MVKNPPAINPWVGKIPLEKGMATHSSNLAWRISWTEDPGGLQSMGSQGVRHDWDAKHACTHTRLCHTTLERNYIPSFDYT